MTGTFRFVAGAAALAAAALAGTAHAGSVPSYYDHLNFNLTSPTAFTHAVGGYANPSVYGMLPGAEAEFYWSDFEESGPDRWGLFLGLRNLGFGVVHTRVPAGSDHVSVTDYRIGTGFGTRALAVGLGYGWSGGDEGAFDREDVAQLALTWRFNRYLSLGASENWGVDTGDRAEIFDVAVRPIGNDRVTLFGDIEARVVKDDYEDDPRWSAGAMLEIPAGLKLIGRWYNDDAGSGDGFSLAVAYSLGGGFGGGVPRASGQFFFDDDSDHALTNWGVRLGYPEKSELVKSLQKKGYVEMAVKGRVAYSTYRFFDTRPTLSNLLDAVNDAREDDRVAGIALNLSGAALSRGQAWELRERLGEFRSVGKKVVVFVDECDLTTYYLASIADRIVMDPEGMMMLPGYVIGRTYIAGMLEKIGVGFEEWRFLKYKSAVETLARRDMSEGDREQRQALVDGYYDTFRDDVAKGRSVDSGAVDRWVDEVTLFTAKKALDEKLVDELGRWEEVKEAVRKMENGERVPMVGPGMVEDRWYPSKQWGTVPKIAVVYAIGPCDMDSGINARRLEKVLRGLREDRDVKAVVLRVDSPGGSALASDIVANQLRRCMEKKPVVISQGDVAASGGYWLSMCSNKILAQPTTITGSIGVISGWAWDKGIGEKVGMEGDHVQRGKHADLFFSLRPPVLPVAIPYRTVTDEERETIVASMKEMYAQFVAAVAKNRRMEETKVEAIAQGRVWTGLAAQENGLIDRIGGLTDAIEVARELAKIGTHDEIDVVEYASRGMFKIDLPTPSLRAPFAGLGILAMSDIGPALAWSGFGGEAGGAIEDDTAWLDDYELSYLRQLVRNNGRAQVLLPADFLPRAGAAVPNFDENAGE